MGKSFFTMVVLIAALAASAQPAASRTSFNAAKNRAAELFKAGEYEAIDRMAAEYLENQTRSPSGLWLLTALYAGLERDIGADPSEAAIIEAERKLGDWASRYSDSHVARIGYGSMLIEHAWFFRGTGMAKTVDEENWTPFREYLEKARLYLAEIEDLGEIDPQWYSEMLVVARAQHWSLGEFMDLVYQGLDLHPYYYDIHAGAVAYLLPKWHGSVTVVEEFASISAKYTREIDGDSMYARVLWQLSYEQLGKDLFTKSHTDWARMSASIDDLLARYPDEFNLNKSARFACMAGDKAKTRELFARIGETPFYAVWPKYGPNFDECRVWANG